MSRLAFTFALLVCFPPCLLAQSCPHGPVDATQLVNQVEHAFDVDTVYRSGAIAGKRIIPALRNLRTSAQVENAAGLPASKTIPGAVQVSLAKLGDKEALEQLGHELNGTNYPSAAVNKLVRVGNDQAIAMLMTYLAAHLNDSSLYGNSGDYGYDLRTDITELLAERLQIGPLAPTGKFWVSLEDWMAWWNRNRGRPIALSISGAVQEPYLQCLARKVEWGFPDAIFDMANTGDPQIVPVLRMLERVGELDFTLSTIHGRAQFALAKLGDDNAFDAIALGLDHGQFDQSLKALQLLGGKKAVATLVSSFDSPNYLGPARSRLAPETIADYEKRKDLAIASALHKMIVHPPDFTWRPEAQKIKWKDWWAKNKDTAQFVVPPMKSYE